MADDWDLYAVVRSCKATTSTTTTATATVENNVSFDNPFFINSLLDEKPDQFQMFEEIYSTTTTTTTTTATATTPLTKQLQTPLQLLQQKHHVMQRVQNIEFKNITFPITSSQPIRPRKKKNQLTKKVRQFTQAELSNDSWAWRKYGQKPIKGSPYPRNYYKCSTTKDCPARKQVECSPTDSNIYIVSYTGEHTHPRPTHRSSLAGSTRTKFSPPPIKPSSTEANTSTMPADIVFPYPRPSCSSSSPVASSSSFSPSPNTPLMEDMSIPNEFKDTFTGFQ